MLKTFFAAFYIRRVVTNQNYVRLSLEKEVKTRVKMSSKVAAWKLDFRCDERSIMNLAVNLFHSLCALVIFIFD